MNESGHLKPNKERLSILLLLVPITVFVVVLAIVYFGSILVR
ncbi:MAG: hypothetical protein AAB694_01310 [Patescibacteria group bacterium]